MRSFGSGYLQNNKALKPKQLQERLSVCSGYLQNNKALKLYVYVQLKFASSGYLQNNKALKPKREMYAESFR